MPEGSIRFPWESYYRSGLISRRQFVKLSTLLGTAVAVGADARMLSTPAPAAAALASAAQ